MFKSKDESRRKYRTEPEAREALVRLLADQFEVLEEVTAVGPEGDSFRIDLVLRCKSTGHLVGVETKKSHLAKSEFADALRQAIHYRLARITDNRLADFKGFQLPTVAVFPDWLGEHDEDEVSYELEAEGMRLVGAQMRVSTFREDQLRGLSLYAGQGAIWHLQSGWTKNADGWLHGKRKRGAMKRRDH